MCVLQKRMRPSKSLIRGQTPMIQVFIKATIAGFGHLNSDLDNDYIHLKDANFLILLVSAWGRRVQVSYGGDAQKKWTVFSLGVRCQKSSL